MPVISMVNDILRQEIEKTKEELAVILNKRDTLLDLRELIL